MNLGRALPSVLTVMGMLLAWHLVAAFALLPSYILPFPGTVLESLAAHPSLYARHFSYTGMAALVGGSLASGAGIVCGWSLAYSQRVERAFSPMLVASQVFPKEALAPIILLLFGYGISSKIVVSFLLSFFPVCIAALAGVQAVPSASIDYGKSLGLKPALLFLWVKVPHSLPYVASSIKVAFTLSVIGAVVGEFIGSQAGLGYLIRHASAEFATERVYGALVLLGVLGGVLYGLALLFEVVALRRFPPAGVSADD